MRFTGYAPTLAVVVTTAITPGTGALTATGGTGRLGQAVLGTTGALTFTGGLPSGQQVVTPGTGALSATGASASLAFRISPATGPLSFAGATPTISKTGLVEITVPSGSLSFTGYVPTITQASLTGPIITPAAGSLVASGVGPINGRGIVGSAGQAAFAETTQGLRATRIAPSTGAMGFAGLPPYDLNILVVWEAKATPGTLGQKAQAADVRAAALVSPEVEWKARTAP